MCEIKRCLIVTGGELSLPFANAFLQDKTYELVIAVDAGLVFAEKLGLHPDLVVGDFDTLGRERMQKYREKEQAQWEVHRPEKDESDTELAFSTAIAQSCTKIDVLGATGGRLDHELSNIHLLALCMRKGIEASLYDSRNRIYLLDAAMQGERVFNREEVFGRYISFLPLTEQVRGITLTGFKYPLVKKDISIYENPSLCVSNELVEERAVMTFDEGILICVESHD